MSPYANYESALESIARQIYGVAETMGADESLGQVANQVLAPTVPEPQSTEPEPDPEPDGPLVDFTGANLAGEATRIDIEFRPAMERIHGYAVTRGVTIHVTSSFRAAEQTVEGAVVEPATNSNHLAGHAIDMNLIHAGQFYNSGALALDNLTNLPEAVQSFIQDIRDDPGLRWGGDFSTPDVVHIDDHLNADMNAWQARYQACQQAYAAGE